MRDLRAQQPDAWLLGVELLRLRCLTAAYSGGGFLMRVLEGVRVLDLTHWWFGPYCTMLLGAMGADVIKVEPPWGEMIRFRPPLVRGANSNFVYFNRDKRSLTLNLKNPKAVQIVKDLAKISDIFVENFSPGTVDRLGVGYAAVSEVNPRIVYASLSGYGQDGPYRSRPSFDIVGQAMCGIMRLTGDIIDPKGPPVEVAEAIGDLIPALYATIGIMAGLRYRDLTGRGLRIDVAQTDTMIAMTPAIVLHTLAGMRPYERSLKFFTGVYGLFQASDGFVVMGAPMGSILDRLGEATGIGRIENEGVVREWVRQRTVREVVDKLVEYSVPVAPVLAPEDVVKDPHVLARNMIIELEHPQAGRLRMPNFPLKFSEEIARVERPAPLLGQHNEEVLTGLLGYTPEQVSELKKEGVL
jgi:CoA:oxalate CoA-transferase